MSERNYRHRRFIMLVKTKVISMRYGSKAMEMNEAWRDFLRCEIYISIPILNHPQNSAAVAEAPVSKISVHTFQTIMKTVPIRMKIIKSCVTKRSISLWIWRKLDGS